MHFEYEHSLSPEEARQRLEALGDYLSNRHGIGVTWNGDRAAFSGRYMVVRIEGELAIGAKAVTCNGKDPGFLWRKKATDYMRGKLQVYLDPTTPVDKLPRR